MSIDITEFANAVISVSPTGVATGNFGILGFLTNESGILPPERGRAYTSLNGVFADWEGTEVYKAATAFYSQTPQPKDFVVISVYETDQPAVLVGGASDTVAELATLNTGTFNITVGATAYTISFDLTGVTTYSEAATVIDTALSTAVAGAGCIHNGYSFVITTDASGAGLTLSFGTGTNSDNLGFSQHLGIISEGFNAETPVAALGDAVNKGIDFIGLVTHKKYRDITGQTEGTNIVDIADWAEASKKIFMNTTNNLSTLSSVIVSDVGSLLQAKTLKYSMTNFAKDVSQYPSASIFGRAASVNFEGIATTITLNLKQMPTITAENLTASEYGVLKSKNVSAVITIGKSTNAFTSSRMASGSWLDTVHGLLWLENRIEVDMFNLMYRTTTKIPYTQTGINITIATLEKSLLAAVRNGLAGPGVLPDGTYLPDGYIIEAVSILDVSQSDKSNRLYRGLKFKMIGAGALHEVQITGEFSE